MSIVEATEQGHAPNVHAIAEEVDIIRIIAVAIVSGVVVYRVSTNL